MLQRTVDADVASSPQPGPRQKEPPRGLGFDGIGLAPCQGLIEIESIHSPAPLRVMEDTRSLSSPSRCPLIIPDGFAHFKCSKVSLSLSLLPIHISLMLTWFVLVCVYAIETALEPHPTALFYGHRSDDVDDCAVNLSDHHDRGDAEGACGRIDVGEGPAH